MSRLPDGDEGAEAALDAWVEMVAHNQRHPDGVALYTAMSAAVIDASHQAHPWFRQHLMATIEYLVGALERGKAAGEVLPDAPSEQIARNSSRSLMACRSSGCAREPMAGTLSTCVR